MNIPSWLTINIYTMALLFMLLGFNSGTPHDRSREDTYRHFLAMTLILLTADTISRLDPINIVLFTLMKMGDFFLFVLDPLEAYFTLQYIDSWKKDARHTDRGMFPSNTIQRVFMVISVVNVVLVVLDAVLGLHWFCYYVGTSYRRGDFFLARAAILLLQYISLEIYVAKHKDHFHPTYYMPISLLPMVVPTLGALQVVLPDVQLEYVGTVFAALLLLVYVQNSNVNEDYLTGISNRRALYTSLERAVAESHRHPFAAIMIDVDYFKQINDTYGHSEGDAALATVVHLLKKSFHKNALISRYGGDEFCVVIPAKQEVDLEAALCHLKNNLAVYNEHHYKPYAIELSYGGALYDPSKAQTADEFLSYVDSILYEVKEEHHRKRNAKPRK